MRMLFLTTRFPFPPIGGERLRPFYFIKYLAAHWKITVINFSESEAEKKALKDFTLGVEKIHSVTLPRWKSYLHCLGGFFSQEPLEFAYYANRKMEAIIEKEISSERYDLIFCHLLRMAPYVQNIKGVKKVLDLCDALSLRYTISSRYRKGPFKFIEWLESGRLTKYEAKVSETFDLNLVSSYKDKNYLEEKIGMRRLDIIENGGMDTPDLEQREIKVDFRKIVFLGNLRTFHNADAVRYFYKRIFPLVKEKISDAKFIIVGALAPRCILQMRRDPCVRVFEDVTDIRPFIKDACVSIAPMRIAVGVQNKILQSMANRIPVVTTTLGLGGIKAGNDKEVLIADTPEEFAEKIVMLMRDENLRVRLLKNAQALIKEQYLWPDICERLNKKLIDLLEG